MLVKPILLCSREQLVFFHPGSLFLNTRYLWYVNYQCILAKTEPVMFYTCLGSLCSTTINRNNPIYERADQGAKASIVNRYQPYFIEYSVRMSIVRILILRSFLAKKRIILIMKISSNLQAIFQLHFQ